MLYMLAALTVLGWPEGAAGQSTTTTIIPRQFKYEKACFDMYYGQPQLGWDYYEVRSKAACQMKCVQVGPTCVAFFYRPTASWCRLNEIKHENRTDVGCSGNELVDYAEETDEQPLRFAPMPKTYCTVNENCTNAVDVADGERWRLCDGGGPGSCHPRKGRLEVEYQGAWGTVCDDSFYGASGTINMNIACRMFGYSGGAASLADDYNAAYFGEGVGPIWLDEVYCTGTETLLSGCPNMGWGNNDCGHSEDQGIVCN